MRRLILLAATALVLFVWLVLTIQIASSDPPPALANQPRPDQFQYAGASLDVYNPLSKKVRQTGLVRWAYRVEPGCTGGAVLGSTIGAGMGNIYNETGTVFVFIADGSPVDLTIRTNCGVSFSAVCGTGAAACLGRSYPYNLDIDFNQDVATYFEVSRISVVLHELMGHALGTWNEQYGSNFGPSPGWVDFMNTGPDSRHLISDLERARWGRTMGARAPTRYGLGEGFLWFCGLDDRATGVALFGWDGSFYRFIGAIPLDVLPVAPDGCRGMQTAGYVRADEQPCLDIGNAVDWQHPLYRSDRCFF